MPIYLTPGVYFETVDASRREIRAIRTDIAAFVGISERGPLNLPVRVNSWEQFQSVFGNFIPNGYLAYTAKAFFENGGQTSYIVRIAATPRTETDPNQLQPNDGSASVALSLEGFTPGDVVIVRQGETSRADHLLRDVDQLNKLLIWEQPLEPVFALNDPNKPISFETGALPARGVLLDQNGVPTLRIEASSPGSWGNALTVRAVRSSNAATRTSNKPQLADRAASTVESLVGFPAGSLVKIFQPGTPDVET